MTGLLETYEARIAALERLVGKQALELEHSQGGSTATTSAEKRDHIRNHDKFGVAVAYAHVSQWATAFNDFQSRRPCGRLKAC